MTSLTVNSKGQVTLDLLRHLDVAPGEKIEVNKLRDGRPEIKALRARGKISDAFNFLKKKKNRRTLSIREIAEISQQGWTGKR
ncbi:MAG: AbrB/MazE/SpoVT family DNA-binding domain-containing protein [Alphaproteobacteria bacterium]|nr:AbrB/MazE/SpoVT family DNA-binding domain-containing protein [Alphaproteobacteria bacterium]MBV8411017.1 AbrB/MazE/SpoVT family DNA-binding domain-containing protein [Alphaproteobacteria bacterium]